MPNSATPWTGARQTSLSITNSQSLLKLMSIELVMPSHHLILCRPLLLLPSTFPSIRVFSNDSVLHIRGPKYWSFNFSISLMWRCCTIFEKKTMESLLLAAKACLQLDGLYQMCEPRLFPQTLCTTCFKGQCPQLCKTSRE